jgi:hypothetical protein
MRPYISNNLITCYNIINTIHNLYIKYKQYIKYKSFTPTGYGIDTIYNIYQIKKPNIFICLCKVLYYDNYIILPIKIITIFGIWTFIDEPTIINLKDNINYIRQYMNELQTIFEFKYIFHAFHDEYSMIFNQMFIITKFNNYRYLLPDKINNLKIDINIYDYCKIKDNFEKFSLHFFNQYLYGPDIINYEFNNFIELIVNLNIINDKNEYFKYYKCNKSNTKIINNFINRLKKIHMSKKIYKNYNNIYKLLFLYTYIDINNLS